MAENSALIPEGVIMYTQTEALKEAKDLSKNLVSGDFERQYSNCMMDKNLRKKRNCVIFGVSLGALAVWLLILTIVREIQITRLRQEVEQLSANMIAISANVMSLNQKVTNNKFINELITLEDTLYADDVENNSEKSKEITESLDKLQGLTVLDSDTQMADDEDMYDGDNDEESGDWYSDYDRRREKIGSSNMVRLKADDFTDASIGSLEKVISPNMVKLKPDEFMGTTIGLLEKSPYTERIPDQPINELHIQDYVQPPPHVPSPEPEIENSSPREKRSLFPDDTPDNAEYPSPRAFSKDERWASSTNCSFQISQFPHESSTHRPVKFPAAAPDNSEYRSPRVISKVERRKTKKFMPNSITESALHAVSRTARSNDEDAQRRPFIAAHFHGNTSHLNTEIHEHYKGNGLVRVSHGAPHDVWYPSPWTIASPHPRPTLTRSGHVHVHHTGVYLVYVQIYYLDSHDVISWVLHRTNSETEGRDTLLQCAQSSHSSEPFDKPNSCFSAAALFLRAGDRLAVRNTGGDRHSLMQPEKSFIGLVKLADAEQPDEEF